MSKSEAAGMASSAEVQKLTQCGISKSMLEALRSAMYSPNCLDMSKSDIKQQLLRLAYLQLSPDNLQALRNALYSPTDGLDLDKKTAASRAVELAIKQVNVGQLKQLYQVLSSSSGLNMAKKDAQVKAMELAVAGADAQKLKAAYSSSHMTSKDPALWALITPMAVSGAYDGLARRYAKDITPYTAAEFLQYYNADFLKEWNVAPQEQRLAPDQMAYSISVWADYFGNGWQQKWTQSKTATQRRLAEDGQIYNIKEFKDYYKDQWQAKWGAAAILPCEECRGAQ